MFPLFTLFWNIARMPQGVLQAGCDIYFCNHLPLGEGVKTDKNLLLYETTIK